MGFDIQTFKAKAMPIFFFCLAIYTLITLIQSALEVSRKKLNLSSDPPNSRCVTFFDDTVKNVEAWNGGFEWGKVPPENLTTIPLYDYMAGEAIVRLCTNISNYTVIDTMGKDAVYTPFRDQGCPIEGADSWGPKIKNDNWCKIYNQPHPNTTCREVLDWAPCPAGCTEPPCCQGWGFAWDIQEMTGNFTNTTTRKEQPYPKCFMRFEKLEGLPKCNGKWVGIFHKKSPAIEGFLWFTVAVPVIVFLAQCYMLHKFDPAPPFDDDYYVSFAMRGIPGPIYQFWWVYIAKRGKFPQAKLKLPAWGACALQDAVEGLAAPIVAMFGCGVKRFPLQLTLLILKIIKFLVDAFMYFRDDGENDVHPELETSKSTGDLAAAGLVQPQPTSPYQQMPPQQQPMYDQYGQPIQQYQQPYQAVPQQQPAPYSNPQGGAQYASTTEV